MKEHIRVEILVWAYLRPQPINRSAVPCKWPAFDRDLRSFCYLGNLLESVIQETDIEMLCR